MTTSVKTSTCWKQLASTYDVDKDGTLHSSMHFVETNSGHDFVVTVSGHKSHDAGFFIGAMLAFAEAWKVAAGDTDPFPTVTHVPRAKDH